MQVLSKIERTNNREQKIDIEESPSKIRNLDAIYRQTPIDAIRKPRKNKANPIPQKHRILVKINNVIKCT
jgi:hypothetical protein